MIKQFVNSMLVSEYREFFVGDRSDPGSLSKFYDWGGFNTSGPRRAGRLIGLVSSNFEFVC